MQIGQRNVGGVVSVRVTTGGTGYTSAPTVTVGGGTGSQAFAIMAGSQVQAVCIASPGTGFVANPSVSFDGGGGTGAAGVASVYSASSAVRPMSFFKGRYGNVYGVDGMGRGIRWDGSATAVQPIGLNPPATAPVVSAASTTAGKYLKAVQVIYGGAGYFSPPTVAFTGGTPSVAAEAVAVMQNGRVSSIKITKPGSGYQATPSVTLSGGVGSGVSLTTSVVGKIDDVRITAQGASYRASSTISPPSVSLSNTNGLTGALVTVSFDSYGRISAADVLSGGTGATASGVVASVTGGSGAGAALAVDMKFRVATVAVSSAGTGYYVPPAVTFRPAVSDATGFGGSAEAAVNAAGEVTGITVINGGAYSAPPSVLIESTAAEAQAEIASPLSGKYQCCMRYLDDTPITQGGPIASSISQLVEVDAGTGVGSIAWTLSHSMLDDRVTAVELWRTTSGQRVILFRVATILRSAGSFTGTYYDTLPDDDLRDPKRNGYALMPVTLPSGQVNARRFGVPPGEFAVGCMFQDRAWYAVDTTGARPNALMYSEVDEPESVPEVNELVVQENTGEPDKIVALVPLGGHLLVVQTAHIYKLTYVAQPVIDASVLLVGYRGVLNARCWATMNGVVFLVDSQGMYAFDGSSEESVSVAVDDYWRNGAIDFSKSDTFHVSADSQTKTVRFYYCKPSDSEPTRALCYCIATKAWWEETYNSAVTATCRATVGGRVQVLSATSGGAFLKESGTTDSGTPVPYSMRTGAMALQGAGNRSVDILFKPTTSDATLSLALHYNNSDTARANAISTDRGGAFVTTAGSTAATLNLKKSRSALGDASGQARAHFSGRVDERSVGADRHVSVSVSGSQGPDEIVLHNIAVDGVG
jgi:hypothetical protein